MMMMTIVRVKSTSLGRYARLRRSVTPLHLGVRWRLLFSAGATVVLTFLIPSRPPIILLMVVMPHRMLWLVSHDEIEAHLYAQDTTLSYKYPPGCWLMDSTHPLIAVSYTTTLACLLLLLSTIIFTF